MIDGVMKWTAKSILQILLTTCLLKAVMPPTHKE